MIQYTHRNGEVEPPTVDGTYWFKGECHHQGGSSQNSCVTISQDGTLMLFKNNDMIMKYGTYCWICGELVTVSGRWWGPIIPPWEER